MLVFCHVGFSSLALWWELEELGGFEGSYIFGTAMQFYNLNAKCCLKSGSESEPEFSKNAILEAGIQHTQQSNGSRESKGYPLGSS